MRDQVFLGALEHGSDRWVAVTLGEGLHGQAGVQGIGHLDQRRLEELDGGRAEVVGAGGAWEEA
ncbi:hypothetical protein PPSIR1_40440 [Plesiocystis pacifica SIR-1]|uniref:Uncharacterized protein n=1 Tax=Plesiocystis pacifica SIR-1 TaxID=391625 RepID=A6FYL8_9BACT|nr:hypothetical protein PPSIR1_40440 [Plesiocystis pacifica SIR-1]